MSAVTTYLFPGDDTYNWSSLEEACQSSFASMCGEPYKRQEECEKQTFNASICPPNKSPSSMRVQTSAAAILPIMLQVPLPDIPGQFECARAWGPITCCEDNVIKYMELKSKTPKSFIQSILVLGYRNHTVKFEVNFGKHVPYPVCDQFIKDLGFKPNPAHTVFYASEQPELMAVVRLAAQNEFPPKELDFMSRLSVVRNWRFVEGQMLLPKRV